MCTRVRALFLAITLAIGGIGAITTPMPIGAAELPGFATSSLRAQLRSSGVPVFLPAQLPPALGDVASIAVISADREGYYVGFSAVPNCGGGLSCATLHIAGYRRTSLAGRAFGHDRPVRLPDGSPGFYSPRDCSGASCTEASLTFARADAIYEIDANLARESLPLLFNVYRGLRNIGAGVGTRGTSAKTSRP